MSRRVLVVLCLLFDLGLVWIGVTYFLRKPLFPRAILVAAPADVGLVWRECELPVLESVSNVPAADEPVACFGRPAPVLGDDERISFGQRVDPHTVQLTIGPDAYQARALDYAFVTFYTLNRNGNQINNLIEVGDAALLFMALQPVGHKVAWAIANETLATIIYDGQDLRHLYGLEKAHAPYGLAGKLIFVAQKGNKYFVMYDGARISPDYDRITIAYCCETALYSVRFGQGRYLFRGTRDGREYIVEISLAPGAPAGAGPSATTPVDPNDPPRRDLEPIARSLGISVDEALRRAQQQGEVGRSSAELQGIRNGLVSRKRQARFHFE